MSLPLQAGQYPPADTGRTVKVADLEALRQGRPFFVAEEWNVAPRPVLAAAGGIATPDGNAGVRVQAAAATAPGGAAQIAPPGSQAEQASARSPASAPEDANTNESCPESTAPGRKSRPGVPVTDAQVLSPPVRTYVSEYILRGIVTGPRGATAALQRQDGGPVLVVATGGRAGDEDVVAIKDGCVILAKDGATAKLQLESPPGIVTSP